MGSRRVSRIYRRTLFNLAQKYLFRFHHCAEFRQQTQQRPSEARGGQMTPFPINKAESCQALLLLSKSTQTPTQENAEIQEETRRRNYREQVAPAEDIMESSDPPRSLIDCSLDAQTAGLNPSNSTSTMFLYRVGLFVSFHDILPFFFFSFCSTSCSGWSVSSGTAEHRKHPAAHVRFPLYVMHMGQISQLVGDITEENQRGGQTKSWQNANDKKHNRNTPVIVYCGQQQQGSVLPLVLRSGESHLPTLGPVLSFALWVSTGPR